MAKQVKRRRGTTAEHATFPGVEGEITVDTDLQTIVVHNGTAPGKYLMRADGFNMEANSVGIVQLDVTDGNAGDFLQTDGNDNLSFQPVDVAGSTLGALGGDIEGTVANALIRDNKVGVDELNVSDGTVNQFLKTDGNKNLSFGTVVTDPTMGGDVGGTTSASVIQPAAVEGSMLDPALKQFTEDATGEVPTGGYNSVANAAFPAGDGTTTTYILSIAAAANNALVVSIDGIMQPTQSYSLPSTTSIQFDDPPPTGSSIRILHIGFQVAASTPADGSVTTIKLGGGAVTNTKLADSASTDSIRAVTTNHIRDDAVTTAKIAQDAVTATEIAPGTITGTEISNASITGLDIASNAIDGSHIAIGTAQGDIMYYDGTNWVRLAAGTATHVLTTTGAGANPYWAAGSSGTALPGVGTSGNVLTSDGTNWASELPHLIQTKYDSSNSRFAVATDSSNEGYNSDVLPTISFGSQFMSAVITPTSGSNILIVEHSGMWSDASTSGPVVAMFADDFCIAAMRHSVSNVNHVFQMALNSTLLVSETGWTSGALTITVRASSGGTITFNGTSGNRYYNTAQKSTLIVREYTP
jgi:hypothetical protein